MKVKTITAKIEEFFPVQTPEQTRTLILELVDVCYELACLYQQMGDAKSSDYFFYRAQNIRNLNGV